LTLLGASPRGLRADFSFYHEIKDFALIMALFSKREIMPLNIEVKYKVEFKNCWDKLKFLLPFNHITIKINEAHSLS